MQLLIVEIQGGRGGGGLGRGSKVILTSRIVELPRNKNLLRT